MQRLIAAWQARSAAARSGRVPALDGLRAFFVFSVLAYHYWQRTWLTPTFTLFGQFISLDPFLRTGYLWVDGLLLLSGFLLYLPQARAKEAGRALPGFEGFYRRRLARVLPSYLLHVLLVFLLISLPGGGYPGLWPALRDLLAHLTFTHPLFPFSSMHTQINGALWTLGVEVQFYLLFPLLARAFRRMPLATWLGAAALAFLYRGFAMTRAHTPMLVNQLPGFLDVYLNGFVLAGVFARLEKSTKDDGLQRVLMSAVTLAAVMGLAVLIRHQALQRNVADVRVSQLAIRFPQSVLTGLLLLGACFSLGGVRVLLGSRPAAFLGAISYQVYLWHQVVAQRLSAWRFPPSVNQNPWMVGDRAWQWGFLGAALALTLLISVAAHYLVEKPAQRRLLGGQKR